MKIGISHGRLCAALAAVLRPLASLVLRSGLTYVEFCEIAKREFVKSVFEDNADKDRRITIAQASAITKLTRKEVRRLCSQATETTMAAVSYRNIAAEVLNSWFTRDKFVAANGRPRALVYSGRKRSFSELVKSTSAESSPAKILKELQQAGAVTKIGEQTYLPTRREFIPASTEEKTVEGLQYGVRLLLETVNKNSEPDREVVLFQRIVHSNQIPIADLSAIRTTLTDRKSVV